MALKHYIIVQSLNVDIITMNPFVPLSTIEILLSIVHYLVMISFVFMIGQITWIFISIYREKSNDQSE
jgi:hypothetical protein